MTQDETLTGPHLAVVVAEEVMGWPMRTVIHQGDGTFVFISEADGRLKKCVREDDHCTMEHWEPWRDPRAWWEIVEHCRKLWRTDDPEELYWQFTELPRMRLAR